MYFVEGCFQIEEECSCNFIMEKPLLYRVKMCIKLSAVERAGRNPFWCCESLCCDSRYTLIRLLTILSTILEAQLDNEIGL